MGWQQLSSILKESREESREAASEKVTKCPECDFTGLKENSKRELLCPICGWRGNK
jgi:rubrerythrin